MGLLPDRVVCQQLLNQMTLPRLARTHHHDPADPGQTPLHLRTRTAAGPDRAGFGLRPGAPRPFRLGREAPGTAGCSCG